MPQRNPTRRSLALPIDLPPPIRSQLPQLHNLPLQIPRLPKVQPMLKQPNLPFGPMRL
jgi:hypothetical protein